MNGAMHGSLYSSPSLTAADVTKAGRQQETPFGVILAGWRAKLFNTRRRSSSAQGRYHADNGGILVFMRSCAAPVAVLLIATALGATSGAAETWRTYSFNGVVSFDYPAAWVPIEQGATRLHILSGPKRAEGVIITADEAQIVVSLSGVTPDDLNRFIASHPPDKVLSDSELPATRASGCERLRKIVALDEIGPDTYETSTTFFCVISNRTLMVAESNFQGSKHQQQYAQTALHIAQSIRLGPSR
jgi:hypothetical protein